MRSAERTGRIEGLGDSRGAGNVRHAAARMTASVAVAAVVVGVIPARESMVSPAVRLSADSTALIMGGTGVPKPDAYYIDTVKNQYIAPTHPTQTIEYVSVMTPEEGWPLTGVVRLAGSVFGSPSIWGPGSSAWPDEPWWKLSGLFDLTYDQSTEAGVADLEAAMAKHGNDHLVIYGYSQGAMVAIREKRKLAEQYPGTDAPDIDFVLSGDLNLPNGGLLARFPGLYIPIFDVSFNGAEPTDTPFDTVVIIRQYEGVADFPLYPLNFVADLNAALGSFYVHLNDFDVSLADNNSAPVVSTDPTGKNTYYFFETEDLPLFGPLRSLGVPEPLIDVVEPFFRVLVELGYDRSIPLWEPTPARLIPKLDPATVAADLVNAIGDGITKAGALIGLPAPLGIPAAPAGDIAQLDTSQQATPLQQGTKTDQTMSKDTAIETRQSTPTESKTGNRQKSTDIATTTTGVIETAKADKTSTEPTAVDAPEPSAGASPSESAKPSTRSATPRRVVRGSPGALERLSNPPHRRKGGEPTMHTAPTGDKTATTRSNPSGGDSSGGDAGDS